LASLCGGRKQNGGSEKEPVFIARSRSQSPSEKPCYLPLGSLRIRRLGIRIPPGAPFTTRTPAQGTRPAAGRRHSGGSPSTPVRRLIPPGAPSAHASARFQKREPPEHVILRSAATKDLPRWSGPSRRSGESTRAHTFRDVTSAARAGALDRSGARPEPNASRRSRSSDERRPARRLVLRVTPGRWNGRRFTAPHEVRELSKTCTAA